MTPKSGSFTSSPQPRLRKNRVSKADDAATVVRAFSTLVKRRGNTHSTGKHAVAVDGTIGGLRPRITPPSTDADSHAKSKRQLLDEKARAYSKFCKNRS